MLQQLLDDMEELFGSMRSADLSTDAADTALDSEADDRVESPEVLYAWLSG